MHGHWLNQFCDGEVWEMSAVRQNKYQALLFLAHRKTVALQNSSSLTKSSVFPFFVNSTTVIPNLMNDFEFGEESSSKCKPKLRVMMLGLRGFPNVQGGVETHAEHLSPLLVSLGCQVEVLARSPYYANGSASDWQGVKFIRLWAPKSKTLEALLHTFLGVLYAVVKRPDILHIHAVGPALMTPLARLLGIKVVVTHHGPDYDRQKWGWLARRILVLGESLGMRFSNGRIAISSVIQALIKNKYKADSAVIFNGVIMPDDALLDTHQHHVLSEFDLIPSQYVLLVSRLVPEKRHFDLIHAFVEADIPNWKLVIVGASDHPDDYVQRLVESASSTANVVMTGYQTGASLQCLYANAGMFVLPSSHEGLSISLLEALSYGLPALASDIPANLAIELPHRQYFSLGNVSQLAQKMSETASMPLDSRVRNQIKNWVSKSYNWQGVAAQTLKEYQRVMKANN